MQKATLGSGCFWCVEAVFQTLKGVNKVLPGYSGGKISNPTYREVCSGLTGHAEVVQIEFDEKVISFIELLEVFSKLNNSKAFPSKIVTEVVPFKAFYEAEEYHKNYFINNPEQGYCQMVVRPKVEKFKKVFENKLK
mgnify:CR=1 FL=1